MTRSPKGRAWSRIRTLVAVGVAVSMILIAQPLLAASDVVDRRSLAGTWRGKMDGLPAVDLTLVSSGQLSGTATFHVIGGPTNIGEKSVTNLRNLKFADGVLSFDVERPLKASLQMSLKVLDKSQAELREGPATGEGPVIDMKKQR